MTGILGVYRRWPTREACIRHLEAVRWGASWLCPRCVRCTRAWHATARPAAPAPLPLLEG